MNFSKLRLAIKQSSDSEMHLLMLYFRHCADTSTAQIVNTTWPECCLRVAYNEVIVDPTSLVNLKELLVASGECESSNDLFKLTVVIFNCKDKRIDDV